MAPVFVRSKNRNEVRPKTSVAGPIARSPSPATGAGKGKDPARQQPGAQQAHLSGYATYQGGIQSVNTSAFIGTNPADEPITSGCPSPTHDVGLLHFLSCAQPGLQSSLHPIRPRR